MKIIINISLVILSITLLSGCASERGKRHVGVGISKSSGQKPTLNVGVSRDVGKHGSIGASRSIK